MQNGGAPIREQIAEKLAGREFATFDDFREAFWTEVVADPELARQFDPVRNLPQMRAGKAPFAPASEHQGKNGKFELDHIDPLFNGGDVYNIDNLRIMTPRAHTRKTIEERK